MKEERLMILSMLKEGKITVEQATDLLEALEESNESTNKDNTKHKKNEYGEERHKKITNKTLEEIGSDISAAVSNMIDGLRDMGSSFGFNTNSESIVLELEEDLTHIDNPILDLSAINGSITLNQTTSDKLSIEVNCLYKNGLLDNNREFYKFYTDEDIVVFKPIYNSDIAIKLNVYVPNKIYDRILLNTTNGKIHIQDVNLNILNCITTNGSITGNLINANDINLTTKNGRIEATNVSSEKIRLSTSNGRIVCSHIDINRSTDVRLTTSNGSISSNLNDLEKGTYFDLDTSMGSVNLDIPNLIYISKNQVNMGNKRILAHSSNYDESGSNLNYYASTSNGSIKIS